MSSSIWTTQYECCLLRRDLRSPHLHLEVAEHQLGLEEGDLGGVADAERQREAEGRRADAADEAPRPDVDDQVVVADAQDPNSHVFVTSTQRNNNFSPDSRRVRSII